MDKANKLALGGLGIAVIVGLILIIGQTLFRKEIEISTTNWIIIGIVILIFIIVFKNMFLDGKSTSQEKRSTESSDTAAVSEVTEEEAEEEETEEEETESGESFVCPECHNSAYYIAEFEDTQEGSNYNLCQCEACKIVFTKEA